MVARRSWGELAALVIARHERWDRELDEDIARISKLSFKETDCAEIMRLDELSPWVVSLDFFALTAPPERVTDFASRLAQPVDAVGALPGGSLIGHDDQGVVMAMYLELLHCMGIESAALRVEAHVRHVLLHGRFRSARVGTRRTLALLALAHGELDTMVAFTDKKPLRKKLDAAARFDKDPLGMARHLAAAIRIGAGYEDVAAAWTSFVAAAPTWVMFDREGSLFTIWDLILLARAVVTHILKRPAEQTVSVLRTMLEGTFVAGASTASPSPALAWRELLERYASRADYFEREFQERLDAVTKDLDDDLADAAMGLRWVAAYGLTAMLAGRAQPVIDAHSKLVDAFGATKLAEIEAKNEGPQPMLGAVLFLSFVRAAGIGVSPALATAEARWMKKLVGKLRDLDADDKRRLAFVALAQGNDELALKLAKGKARKSLGATWAIHEPLGFISLVITARATKAPQEVVVAMFESLVSQAPTWTSERLLDDESLVDAARAVFADAPLARLLEMVGATG